MRAAEEPMLPKGARMGASRDARYAGIAHKCAWRTGARRESHGRQRPYGTEQRSQREADGRCASGGRLTGLRMRWWLPGLHFNAPIPSARHRSAAPLREWGRQVVVAASRMLRRIVRLTMQRTVRLLRCKPESHGDTGPTAEPKTRRCEGWCETTSQDRVHLIAYIIEHIFYLSSPFAKNSHNSVKFGTSCNQPGMFVSFFIKLFRIST